MDLELDMLTHTLNLSIGAKIYEVKKPAGFLVLVSTSGGFLNFFDIENLFLISKISTSGFLKMLKFSLVILAKRFLLARY